MKKLVSVIALFAAITPAFAANNMARASHLVRNQNGSYNVTYSYEDRARSVWYGSVRAELNFLNWKNKYSTTGTPFDPSEDHDDFSFEPLFGLDIAVGRRIDYFWRAEVEAGYISEFTDKDAGTEFAIKIPYVMANGYYDFSNGLYLGAGLGLSFPTTKLDSLTFVDDGNRSKTGLSPMFGLMAGYAYRLNDNFLLDLRYRFAGTWGTSQKRKEVVDTVTNKIGFIMDNSISVGLRYEF